MLSVRSGTTVDVVRSTADRSRVAVGADIVVIAVGTTDDFARLNGAGIS